jgi:transcriptional regulator with XRE-family HTH domain
MNEEEIHIYICNLGDKLKSLRNSKGFSQQELSFRSGIEKPYIRRIEKGRTNPTIKTLLKLSFALEIPIQVFFEDFE